MEWQKVGSDVANLMWYYGIVEKLYAIQIDGATYVALFVLGGNMAQSWAIKLYKSQAWLDCRESYIASVNGICESCVERGLVTVGYIVHHKIWLTPNNINDPNITLNHEHLMYECLNCHNSTHRKKVQGITSDGLKFDEFGDLVLI